MTNNGHHPELITSLWRIAHGIEACLGESKRQFEWFKSHSQPATLSDLKATERTIVMTQLELAAGLKLIETQVGKVAKEQSDRFDALTKQITDLNAVIQAGGEITPEVNSALTGVQAALNALDETIPDAPATPA